MIPITHLCLALLVVLIWGCNFLFIHLALEHFPPFLLCAMRFLLASFPAILFIKPPKTNFKYIAGYGLIMFGLQFTLLFIGMDHGMTPGLTSLLLQVQIFLSIFFAMIFLGERPQLTQLCGAVIAFSGIAVVAMHINNQTITLTGFILVIAAAASWGIGNLITKRMGKVNMIAMVVWGSFIACWPLLLLSLLIEGPRVIEAHLLHFTMLDIIALFYIVYLSTWVGYGVWNFLLSRHPVSAIVPFTLLVPVFGMLSSAYFFNEKIEEWKLLAGFLVLLGLSLNLFGPRLLAKKNIGQKQMQYDVKE